ncbi:hypothetical protein BKA70DRAFT_1287755 [Coprinopsis sp. MPI-PUGE-AT-0042]|nr:hypothetical protein BKA70DRAFT_1287755 [Coprinopsis sp. MPI-PUGE-AT-0042]
MFSVPSPDGVAEGKNEEKPIVLEGYKSVDFERLLSFLDPSLGRPDWILVDNPLITSKEEWVSVLRLATAWNMTKVRNSAVQELSKLRLPAIEKIQLGREFLVAKWFSEGVEEIGSAPDISKYALEDLSRFLGWETAAKVLWIRNTSSSMPDDRIAQVNASHILCVRKDCPSEIRSSPALECSSGHRSVLPNPQNPPPAFWGPPLQPPVQPPAVRFKLSGAVIEDSNGNLSPGHSSGADRSKQVKALFESELNSMY